MPLPDVDIALQNGTLGGLLQTADGVCGMVLTGVTEGDYTAGTPIMIRSYTDAVNLGLTDTDNAFALKQIREFYLEAPEGSELYIMLVPVTMLASDMADNTNAAGAKKLLDYAARRIRYLGLLRKTDGQTITSGGGMDGNIATAETNANVLALAYAANPRQAPLRVVLGAQKCTGVATDLVDGNSLSKNAVSIVVGDTVSGEGAAVGLVLGRKAKHPVQRKISRVKSGALNIMTAFIGTTPAEQYTNTAMIHDKRFITFRTFPSKTGYFFTGDATRTSSTDDYNGLARGGVIDKAQMLAYATFVEEIDDEVIIDQATGKMEAGYCKFLEQKIVNQINGIMTANREISSVRCYIDPEQNVLSTNEVWVVLEIVPVGYATSIKVRLGFKNPALAS